MHAPPGYTPGSYDSRGNYIPTDDEVMAYQAARVAWEDQVVYGYYALAFIVGVLALAVVSHLFWVLRVRYNRLGKVVGYARLAAALRLMSYPRLMPTSLNWIWSWGALGPNLILVAGLLVASCLTWVNKLYYYPPYYGSAPLYLRSEWIAMATLPFVYVLGAKRNMLSVLTGVSHEKLQILHQGAAFNFIYMSLVHTITACIRADREYGLVLTIQFDDIYISGFVALAPLLVLFVGSLPPIRKYLYEAFYYVHIVMALFFLGALFWHGYGLLDNDAYCITTIILFFSSVVWRLGWMLLNNPSWHLARIELLSEDTYKLTVPTYTLKWKAGQHVFLRFMAVRALESHPFTISNMCTAGEVDTMVFLVRSQNGFTKALLQHALRTNTGEYKVLVDGPYGHSADELRVFDSVLVCVGGSGISWAVAVLQALAASPRPPAIKLVWAVRDASAQGWFASEIAALNKAATVEIHVTGGGHDSPASAHSDKEDSPSMSSAIQHGRPDFKAIIAHHVGQAQGSVAVAACGPESLLADCANGVSRVELDILMGRLPEVDEVYFASEAYGW